MVISEALNIAFTYFSVRCSKEELDLACKELRQIVDVDDFCFNTITGVSCDYNSIQEKLSKINEKESIRKEKGVYYTPNDVVYFILKNSIRDSYAQLTPKTIGNGNLNLIPYDDFCFKKTVFDPTCGAGEFLLAALTLKFDMLSAYNMVLPKTKIHKIVATISGNDLNYDSIRITKIRLLLCVANRYGIEYIAGLTDVFNKNFESYDYITDAPSHNQKYDIIVGNPPYVEDSKSGLNLSTKYGNIYANVLVNASKHLTPGGSLGFIVPLSYISTPRMKRLRNDLFTLIPEQFILSYADRPDCLFDSVHQKLCIIIGKKSCKSSPAVYTGNYQYWYKSERGRLFEKISVILNKHVTDEYIPKLGCELDEKIFRKITDPQRVKSVYANSRMGEETVYLNRRETFWMKAYRTYIDDPEYKAFHYEVPSDADYCYCLINSSLFWWYWICTSDCWHVSKELNGFMAPDNPYADTATFLANQLRAKLEETKVFVGTVQTKYEYKHKECMTEIHAIDDFVNNLFGLTEEESIYIKNFALKYRTSGGAQRECN